MTPTIQPKIFSRVIVKPSSPSPNHPQVHNLSFFDQWCPNFYGPVVYFYAQQTSDEGLDNKSTLLRTSLSRLISHYYPVAGRMRGDGISVECNDQGVMFLEARMEVRLSELLENPREEVIQLLFPDGLHFKDGNLSTPLVVQHTLFECGGMAIAICISHKLMDMASICSFVCNWATMTRDSSKEISVDLLKLGTLYPPPDLPPYMPHKVGEETVSTIRIVFSKWKIEKLKAMVAQEVEGPTKVELVTALICKAAMSASKASSGMTKKIAICHSINLRKRLRPVVTEEDAGNFSAGYFAANTEQEGNRKMELKCLVRELRRGKLEYLEYCNGASTGEEVCLRCMEHVIKNEKSINPMNCNMYVFSSWCGFPYYETDFGWGKPAWVTTPGYISKNYTWMMNTRDGDGIEAVITLEEQEMAFFKRHQQLLAFATINPNRLDNRSKM